MLQIIRPKNLILIALLQCFVLFKLGEYNFLFFDEAKTVLLILSTLLIAAAGYIINDYFDVKIDLINKPDRVIIGHELSRRWAIILHISLTVIGLWCAWKVNLKTLAVASCCAVLLYVYSVTLKKQFLTGNIVIALLSALSVIICQAYIGILNDVKIVAYSFFAFFSTLLREIVKDIEDEKGDALFQSNSLAVSLGLRRTKKVLFQASLVFLIAVIAYPLIALELIYTNNLFFLAYCALLIIGIVTPLLLFIIKLRRADKQKDFAQLSRLLKVIMLIGIFSILLS